LGKHSSPTNANLGYFWLKTITRQPIELESCSNFKPSKGRDSLVVHNNIFLLFLDVVFFYVDMTEVCLCIFYLHSDDVIRPGRQRQEPLLTRVFIAN